ncbi:MAG: hypothetical protein H0U59_07165 [Gemmatimonadaceae bacterium]|nr:hypothetical protein [Gemmatimonadaceae bacterium]
MNKTQQTISVTPGKPLGWFHPVCEECPDCGVIFIFLFAGMSGECRCGKLWVLGERYEAGVSDD